MIDEEADLINEKPDRPKPAKPKARKPKPLVEGINSPKNTSNVIFVKPTLTEQEKRVISQSTDEAKASPKLLTPQAIKRAGKKGAGIGSFLLWLLFFLLLAFGGYQIYAWYSAKHAQPAQNTDYSAVVTAPEPSPLPNPLPTPATTTPPTATTTPPVGVKQLMIKDTPTGYLNVRSTPSTSGKLVTQVHPNEVYTYTDSKNGWYQIVLAGGKSGWVTGQYVTLQ